MPAHRCCFAPYGDVVEAPGSPGRAYFTSSLANLRTAAQPKLWMLTKHPTAPLPVQFASLERHEFSSQTFVPIDISRWLVVVAPPDSEWQVRRPIASRLSWRARTRRELSAEYLAWRIDGVRRVARL